MKNFADAHIHIRGSKPKEIEYMLDTLADCGVTDAAIMALPFRSIAENLSALYTKTTYKKIRLRAFGGLHSTDRLADIPFEVQAEKMLDMGFDGIKLMDACPSIRRFNGVGVDNPKYDKMFSLLEERGTPLLMHVSQPKDYWVNYDSSYPTSKSIYDETFEMLRKHPRLNVVFAHFFFLSDDPDEAVRVMETYPNVKFDITPGTEMYVNFGKRLDFWKQFFAKYSNRILFGTDCNTWKNDFNDKLWQLVYDALLREDRFVTPCYNKTDIVTGLGLSQEVIERICYTNYTEFVHKDIALVDTDKMYKACEYILELMKKDPKDAHYERAVSEKLSPQHVNDPEQRSAIEFFEHVLSDEKNAK